MKIEIRTKPVLNLTPKRGLYQSYFKRPMDFILSFCALLALSPVLLVTALLIRVKFGSPIFFKQKRPGLNEKVFLMYKFRTMSDERDKLGNLLPDEIRLTALGKILRSTSLDELPELINIIKGDMSIVGPRPLLTQYLPLYNEYQRRRHDVKPGLTGYAQVNGRNAISWEDKFDFDVTYTQNITFIGDWEIIFKTVAKVFEREGISSENSVTMEYFEGSKEEKADRNIC
jgi:Sugar transferases involved in lipopolysaccharide synthesis